MGETVDIKALRSGDRRALAQAITLLESTRAEDCTAAEKLLRSVMPHTGKSIRIGITGAPGVGKSTFIETFGNRATECGNRVAVLTIDPSSSLSGGSILGDKTRMETLAANPRAFIRPSPSGQTLGGVARRTREAMLACEAAGFDLIIVETVGVGQSETLVAAMTDIFLLMLLPSSGDELQGIKRGIMELADMVIVNKSDSGLEPRATATAADITHALHLFQRRLAAWQVPVMITSAIENTGIDEVRKKMDEYRNLLETNDALQNRRRRQAREWLWNETREQLLTELKNDTAVDAALEDALQQVSEGELPASIAARKLVSKFMRSTT
ncbi:methylmalonyl Co-A mutase-associated GTPase MeaB [Candidatus Spongiihabitans sp.]|uniref:methylmalonyl Co-A mutase-associated GTPase MeaB n=1 Tax=Candidatus Spongiihabitans sp. TaxID=3101308 RepID=UPI003C79DEDB